MQLDEYTLVDFFKILWRRKGLWLLLPIIFVLVATMYLKAKPPQYLAEGALQTDPPPEGLVLDIAHWSKLANKQNTINKAVAIHKKTEGTDLSSDFASKYKFILQQEATDPGNWGRLLLSVKGPDPVTATKLCDAWMNVIVESAALDMKKNLKLRKMKFASRFENLSLFLKDALERRESFFRENGLLGLQVEIKSVKKKLKNLRRQLEKSKSEFINLTHSLGSWEDQLRSLSPSDRDARLFVRKKILKARARREALPGIIESIKENRKELRLHLTGLREKENNFNIEIQKHNAEVSVAKQLIEDNVNRKYMSLIDSMIVSKYVEILTEPSSSGIPIPQRDLPKIIAAGVTGFVMGIILALVLESFSGRRKEEKLA